MIRSLLLAGVVAALSACVTTPPDPRSAGLEDIVTCRLDTPEAGNVYANYVADVRSGSLEKVGPETVSAYAAFGKVTDFHRPKRKRSLFGVEVGGMLFGGMHGSVVLLVLARGSLAEVRPRIEAHGGFVFKADESMPSRQYISGERLFKDGISLGDMNIAQEIQARSMIQVTPETPDRFILGCGFSYDDGYRDSFSNPKKDGG
jgi:hypothetical protein